MSLYPFVPIRCPFSTPTVFWCFQGIEKGCSENKWDKKVVYFQSSSWKKFFFEKYIKVDYSVDFAFSKVLRLRICRIGLLCWWLLEHFFKFSEILFWEGICTIAFAFFSLNRWKNESFPWYQWTCGRQPTYNYDDINCDRIRKLLSENYNWSYQGLHYEVFTNPFLDLTLITRYNFW